MISWLTILFLILAGAFKAVADTLLHHYDISVFRRKDRKFWDPSISWRYAKILRWTSYKMDAWHLFNSAMIFCFCFAAVFHHSFTYWWIEFMAAGIIFNISFGLFYNKILKK
jgi:hypothetical protein